MMNQNLRAQWLTAAKAFGLDAIVGAQPPEQEPEALSAWQNMENNVEPSDAEWLALKRVLPLMRPAIVTREGWLNDLPDYQYHPHDLPDAWDRFRDALGVLIQSVGRVEAEDGKLIGTGFVVESGRVLTNKHVVEPPMSDDGSWPLPPAIVRFCYEAEDAGLEVECPITWLGGVSEHEDLGLLRVEGMPDLMEPFQLDLAPAKDGDRIVALGYPGLDSRNPDFLPEIFGEAPYEILRGAPGEVRVVQGTELEHDCSTLGGNSGSPLLSMETGEVVGVHKGTTGFMTWNLAVTAEAVAQFLDETHE